MDRRIGTISVLVGFVGLTLALGWFFFSMLGEAGDREVQAACASLKPAPRNKTFAEFPQSAPGFSAQDMNDEIVQLSKFKGKVTLVNFWASWCKVCKSEKPSLYDLSREFGDDLEVLAIASDKDWNAVMEAWLSTVEEASYLPRAGLLWRRIVTSKPDWLPKHYIDTYNKTVAADPRVEPLPPPEIAKMWRELRLATSPLPTTPPFKLLLDPPASDDDNLGRVARTYGITAVPESFVIDKDGIIRYYFVNKRDWSSGVAQTCIRAMLDS